MKKTNKDRERNRDYQHSVQGKKRRKEWLKSPEGREYKRNAQKEYRKRKRQRTSSESMSISQ